MAGGRLVFAVSLLLLAAPALPCLPEGPPAAARQPPSSGEWAVSTAESYSSQTLQLNGNLTIRAGGSLSLTAVKLSLAPSFNGEFHIEVQSGGSLSARDKDGSPWTPDDATVLSSSTAYQYLFWVRAGGSMRMDFSIVRNCGYAMGLRGETAGVYLQSSDCAVSNTTFIDCYCGIAVDNCAPVIRQATFTQNRQHGMSLRDSNIVLEDNLFDGNTGHGINIQASSPVLRRNIMRGNFQDGLLAQNSPLVLEQNTYQANARRAVTAEGAPVCSTGEVLIQNKVGFYVSGSTLDCESPYLEDNDYCLYLQDTRASLRNATMLGTRYTELYLGRLSDHTELVSYNNTIHNVSFGDAASLLRVEWLVRPLVVWEGSGAPVAGALVKFYRTATNELIYTFTANDTGELPPLMMAEYEQARAGKVNTSSYRIGIFSGRFVESIRTSITRDIDLVLALDDVPPRFNLSGPRDNLTTPASHVMVNGTMLTDLDATLTVNGEPAQIDQATGNFSVRVELAEGPNLINITAVDPIFNVYTLLRTVVRHSLPPNLTIDIPPEGLLLNRTTLRLMGSTEQGAYVLVNGVPAMVLADGSFEAEISLSEGQNNLTVYSADQYKNSAWANRTILVDTIAPKIAVLAPADGSWTNRPRQAVSGLAEEGATVLFNGSAVPAERGNFTLTVTLSEGPNRLFLWARDPAGNQNTATVLLVLDTIPPGVAVTWPAEGAGVNFSLINITGTTEPDAAVVCHGGNVSTDGRGNFSILYLLLPGPNTIRIDARDPAGNRNPTDLQVVYDTFVSFVLSSPENGTRTTSSTVEIEGLAEPGAAVSVDGLNFTAGPDGSFRVRAAVRTGTNILVINVTDSAGNRATFLLLVRRDPEHVTDPLLLVALAAAVALAAGCAAGWAWLSRRRRATPAAATPPPPEPVILDNQRLVLKAPESPRERLRCASCLQPVDESWAICHTCGGPTTLSEIAPRTRRRLEESEPPGEEGRRLRPALLKLYSDLDRLGEAGNPVDERLRRLTIASQLVLSGGGTGTAAEMAAELERDTGFAAAELGAAKENALKEAQDEASRRMAGLLAGAEAALQELRRSGAETRELERAVSLARLHLRAGSFEKAYEHTLDAKALADRVPGRGNASVPVTVPVTPRLKS